MQFALSYERALLARIQRAPKQGLRLDLVQLLSHTDSQLVMEIQMEETHRLARRPPPATRATDAKAEEPRRRAEDARKKAAATRVGRAAGGRSRSRAHKRSRTPARPARAVRTKQSPPKDTRTATQAEKRKYVCFEHDPARGLFCKDKTCLAAKEHLDPKDAAQKTRFDRAKAASERASGSKPASAR